MGITYAIFRSGRPLMMPYVPPSQAVNAGDLVIVDGAVFIAHLDIAVGYVGQLACGGGIYELTANGTIPVGADAFWDSVAGLVTGNPANSDGQCYPLGKVVAGPLGQISDGGPVNNGDACWVLHIPKPPGSGLKSIGASTAAAGTNAGTAAALPSVSSDVYPTTASDGTKGLMLSSNDKITGRQFFIGNGVSNHPIIVYPPTGGTINGAAANTGYTGVSGAGVWVTCLSGSGNTWFAE
jgi:hypothetical protein